MLRVMPGMTSLQREGRRACGRRERLFGDFEALVSKGADEGRDHELGELAEDDFWFLVDVSKEETKRTVPADSNGRRRRWQVVPPPVHGTRRVGGLSLAFEDSLDDNPPISSAARIIQQQFLPSEDPLTSGTRHSAPVNVPDWSKILPESASECAEGCMSMEYNDDDDGEESEWLPPHEYLARESARRQNPATSVFEGVGRTLKGRDLSRVRNAVWRQTGFFG